MKPLSTLVLLFLMFLSGLTETSAQDTLQVQTLTFDSITARRGVWQFPEGNDYRKVLMYYTLKCDYATTHDQYACGEWDYLTYTTLYQHTGNYDSNLLSHPKYQFINGVSPDSIALTESVPYVVEGNTHFRRLFDDTVSYSQFPVVYDDATSDLVFPDQPDSRTRFMLTADQLGESGMAEGEFSGMNLHIDTPGSDFKTLMVRLSQQAVDDVAEVPMLYDADTVFYAPAEVPDEEWMSIDFLNDFYWDGASNILVDISYSNTQAGNPTILKGTETSDEALFSQTNSKENYTIDLDGEMDYLQLDTGSYFDGYFTFETWLKKQANNTWSRVFDFGNGPGADNVIIALSNSNSGKLSFHVRSSSSNDSFVMDDPLPVGEWVHVALKIEHNVQGWAYINGVREKIGLLRQPEGVQRTRNYIGKSNWSDNAYADVVFDEMRLYDYSRSEEEIQHDMFHSVASPTEEEGLVYLYDFNTPGVEQVSDHSVNENHAEVFGPPTWQRKKGHNKVRDFQRHPFRPDVIFEQITAQQTTSEEIMVYDTIHESKKQYVQFDEDHPTQPTDTLSSYLGGYHYVYHDGQIVDSNYFSVSETLQNEDMHYYGEPFEVIHPIEIGRFITPYGINLDLGPEGFTWIYDVTDYAHLLQGEVDLRAGNQQELIDLRFELIEGRPPRDVIDIRKPWGNRSWVSYKALSEDSRLSDTTLPLSPETQSAKIKTRLTGHGHHSNTGDYPHCCEWKDNTHYLMSNGDTIADWHIFKYIDCAANPVFPQGGTWLGAREGWCPGDKVDDFEFELTDQFSDGELNIDYAITPVPENNQGMGNGNYIVSMHLVEYDYQNFGVDAEVYDVLIPGLTDENQRRNPVCNNPEIVVRNNGDEHLESLQITYGVSGGYTKTFDFTGFLPPNEKMKLVLPVDDEKFWIGDGNNEFIVNVSSPNGEEDEYADNNTFTRHYEVPDLINEPFVLRLRTNKRPEDFDLTIKDITGNVVFERHEFEAETEYYDTLHLEQGCYEMLLTDSGNTGLSYWAWPGQGSGYFMMYDTEGGLMKSFQAEFGNQIRYAFSMGSALHIQEPNLSGQLEVSPNPTTGKIQARIAGAKGKTVIKITDARGRQILQKQFTTNGEVYDFNADLSGHKPGLYLMQVNNKWVKASRKIILQ
jgi:hypothetical protein